MDDAALAVADHLHLDMARPLEIALEIDRIVAEDGFRLGLRDRQQPRELGGVARHLHAAPAAARRGLDQHRVADLARRLARARRCRAPRRPSPARRDAELARASPWRATLSPISRMCSGAGR